MVNIQRTTNGKEEHVKTIDCKGHKNDIAFLADLLRPYIDTSVKFVIADAASSGVLRIIEHRYPWYVVMWDCVVIVKWRSYEILSIVYVYIFLLLSPPSQRAPAAIIWPLRTFRLSACLRFVDNYCTCIPQKPSSAKLIFIIVVLFLSLGSPVSCAGLTASTS